MANNTIQKKYATDLYNLFTKSMFHLIFVPHILCNHLAIQSLNPILTHLR